MAGKATRKGLEVADPKKVAAFKAAAKKKGGQIIEQLPINSWGEREVGFILSGDFVAIREGKKRQDSKMEAGHLLDLIESETGELQTWGCPAILKTRIEQNMVERGDSLEIMFAGYVESRYGTDARDFIVAHFKKG